MPGYEVFGDEERRAINEVFDLNGGILFAHAFDAIRNGVYRVREFEKAFAGKFGSRYAQAVSSGSAALYVALSAMGIRPGDEVITQAFTFVATVEAIMLSGAAPVIVDVDKSLNMCPESLKSAITERTRVIVPVHMMGAPSNMDDILAIAKKYDLQVLEDNAQCCGGTFKGKLLGTIGNAGAFSFDGGKTMITGEGGMVVTDDEKLYVKARAVHDHGHEYSNKIGRGEEGALDAGFNFRMTELQGAIGLTQLKKLDNIIEYQRRNKEKYLKCLSDLPYEFRNILDKEGDIGDSVIFFLENREHALAFARKMQEKGLGTKNLPDAIRWHFARNWKHLFKRMGRYEEDCDVRWKKSADLLERSIALPVMARMTDDQIEQNSEMILSIERILQ